MKSGRFVVWLAVAALAVSLLTMTAMLGVRVVAAGRLQHMATAMRDLAGESIETTITVRQTMPLDAEIRIARPTEIDLALQVALLHDRGAQCLAELGHGLVFFLSGKEERREDQGGK